MQMEVKDIWYSYATRKKTPALRGVSLTMEPGKLLALVGLSGSGKSTLVAMLERLYDPDEGQVSGTSIFWHCMMTLRWAFRCLQMACMQGM